MYRHVPLVLVFAISLLWLVGATTKDNHLLPGAQEVVDAGEYPSIQAALDAVSEDGGLVLLPAGTFEISQPLVIQLSDVCLQGVGAATHIKNTNKTGLPAIIIAHREHKRVGNDRDHELWRVRLADLRVTGNPECGDGIVAHNVNEVFVDGVSISYHGGDGLELSYCYEDPRIVDSLFTYNKNVGVNLVGCHDIVVCSNQFEENHDGLHCFDGFNLCMTGNCLDDHLGRGIVIENTYGSVIAGNMIEECQAAALVMDRDCYGNTVSANVIAHNGAGVDLRDAHGCAISANTFTIMKRDAIRIGAHSGRITLSANSFSDSFIGAAKYMRQDDDRGAAGVALYGPADVLLNGNAFSGIRPQAIRLEAAFTRVHAAITNNYFVDTAAGVDSIPINEATTVGNFFVPSEQ